jgi:hypothetical protein
MKAKHAYFAVALAAALVAVSPLTSSAEGTSRAVGSAHNATAPVDQPRAEDGRAHSNSPHPAVLSFDRPVYPVGVPNPPVSLERY